MPVKPKSIRLKDIKRQWHLIDAQGKILGRLAQEVAQTLMGKKKPYFTRHLDTGDYVVVVNAEKVKITGKKEEAKKYYRHSGYPGGLKEETLKDLRKRKPTEIIRRAVRGMLPSNRLRQKRMRRLKLVVGEKHPYKQLISKS